MTIVTLAQSAAWNATKQLRGVPVVYSDGILMPTVTAVRGELLSEDVMDDQKVIQTRQRDFLIEAEDLVAVGIGTPKVTDTIVDQGETYEVIPTDNEQSWRWHQRFNLVYRIHTKQVS